MESIDWLKNHRKQICEDLAKREHLLKETKSETIIGIFVKVASKAGLSADDLLKLTMVMGSSQMIDVVIEKIRFREMRKPQERRGRKIIR